MDPLRIIIGCKQRSIAVCLHYQSSSLSCEELDAFIIYEKHSKILAVSIYFQNDVIQSLIRGGSRAISESNARSLSALDAFVTSGAPSN